MADVWTRRCSRRWPVIALIAGMAMLMEQPRAAAAPAPQLDSAALSTLDQRMRAGEFENLHGVLVVQGGRTVVESYFTGTDERRGTPLGVVQFGPGTLHDVRSVTKSIVSLLFGIALSEGAIGSIDDPVLKYFPEYAELRTPERMQVRVRDLLSMTSGLHWDERTFPYTDPRNSETAMDLAADRYRHILSQSIDTAPGERLNYSGGDVALVAAVIARAAKMPIEAYAADKLFAPLGITSFEWTKDRAGVAIAASGLRLRPRDMAKLGQLILQRGRAGDRQIVPENWIEAATTVRANVQGDPRCGIQYGYYWWLGTICVGDRQTRLVFATGNGGQTIWIAPALELVVVTTIGQYNDVKGEQAANRIVRAVVAAATGGASAGR